MGIVVENILELIGNTPILRLSKVTRNLPEAANVYLKLEYLNPSGSYKDRIARRMIEEAEKRGQLKPGGMIVESSSGNTATALSFVGGMKGYRVKLFLAEDSLTDEKKKILQRYGAEFESVPSPLPPAEREAAKRAGVPGEWVEEAGRVKCRDLEKNNPTVWWARQFSNPDNVEAHSDMAKEILEQLDGKVDSWVSSVGTGGNLMGVSKELRRHNPRVRCIAVEPTGWLGYESILSGWKTGARTSIPGINDGIAKRIADQNVANEIVQVGNEEAREMAYRLSKEEGLFVGISTGANVHAAINEAKKLGTNRNVVTVAVDRADRYFTDERYIT